ncbi:MAG: SLC13 family permease, partial [Marinibacterium sp.]|nr:SLC13 family permease [Marinibacterium sp.]
MTSDQMILFGLFGAVFALLLWGRFRNDLVAFGALLAGVVLQVIPAADAFAGFGHPATVVVALVLVVSAGLVRSGAVFLITRTLVDPARGLGAHIALMGSVGAVLSAFMNNVAALALLMPVDIQTASKAGRLARLSLMPLSFCTILGGMVTLIGTPPNIIIAGIREDKLGESFAMFDFAPVGGIVALVGIAYVALLGWRLIPGISGDGALADARATAKDYIAELKIPQGSDLIGTRIFELYDSAEQNDVAIIGLTRDGRRAYGLPRTSRLRDGDALVIKARPEALDEFRAALALEFTDRAEGDRLGLAADGMSVVEAVVPETARIVGHTARQLGLAWRQRTVLLGISRQGRRIENEVRRTEIQPGDILLMLVPEGTEDSVTDWLGVLPLADRGLVVTDQRKVWQAIGLFAGAVALAAFGLLYLPVALGLVVVAYVLTGILSLSDLYDHIEWPVVV